jgi:acyl carrier protein
MKKKYNQILKNLEIIFEKKIKPTDKTDKLENFDSIIILQIMNLAKTSYKKNIDGLRISKCKTISEIIDIIS